MHGGSAWEPHAGQKINLAKWEGEAGLLDWMESAKDTANLTNWWVDND